MKSYCSNIHPSLFLAITYFILLLSEQIGFCQDEQSTNKDIKYLIAFTEKASILESDQIKNFKELLGLNGTIWALCDKIYGKKSSQSAHMISKICELYNNNKQNKKAEVLIGEAREIIDFCIKNKKPFSQNAFWHIQVTYCDVQMGLGKYGNSYSVADQYLRSNVNIDKEVYVNLFYILLRSAISDDLKKVATEFFLTKEDFIRSISSDTTEFGILKIAESYNEVSQYFRNQESKYKKEPENEATSELIETAKRFKKVYFEKSKTLLEKNNLKSSTYYSILLDYLWWNNDDPKNIEKEFKRLYNVYYKKKGVSKNNLILFHRNFALFYFTSIQYNKAKNQFEKLVNLTSEEDEFWHYYFIGLLGACQLELGDNNEAIKNLEYSIGKTNDLTELNEKTKFDRFYRDLGLAYEASGNLDLALYYLELGTEVYAERISYRKTYLFELNRNLYDLANLYDDLGMWEDSLDINKLKIKIELQYPKNNNDGLVISKASIASILNEYVESGIGDEYYHDALNDVDYNAEFSRGLAIYVNLNLSESLLNQGLLKSAKDTLNKAKKIRLNTNYEKQYHFDFVEALIFFEESKFKEATAKIQRAIKDKALKGIVDNRFLYKLKAYECLLLYALNDFDGCIHKSLQLSKEANRYLIKFGLYWPYRTVADTLTMRHSLQDLMLNCIQRTDHKKEKVIEELILYKGIFQNLESIRQSNKIKYKRKSEDIQSVSNKKMGSSIVNLLSERSADLKRLTKEFQKDYSSFTFKNIPKSSLVLDYFNYRIISKPNKFFEEVRTSSTKTHYLFIAYDRKGLIKDTQLSYLCPSEELDILTNDVIKRMYDVEFNPTDLNERISKISKIILDGTIDTINNYDHLLIIPSGGLCKFPFELLKDDESYLIEKKFITYLNSSIELTRVAKENNRKIKLSPSVIVSDPDYDLNVNEKAISQSPIRRIKINEELNHEFTKTPILRSGINFRDKVFKRLPYTKLESETYRIIFKGKAINLEQKNATELNVNKLKSPEILHFATHAYYLKDTRTIRATHPFNMTGLALAGANVLPHSSNRNFSNDGILTGSEVCALTLTGTKIVILSACETSVGDYLESEGLFSLSKAFRIAGAQSVLATHWPVSDKASARFTSQFLINLSEGLSPKEAIRKVKLNFINSGIPYNNPFFWGAFTLSGNWKN